jgi:hypothetical protein
MCTVIHFGKYKGLKIEALPSDYLKWLLLNVDMDDDLYEAIEEDFDDRGLNGSHFYEAF